LHLKFIPGFIFFYILTQTRIFSNLLIVKVKDNPSFRQYTKKLIAKSVEVLKSALKK